MFHADSHLSIPRHIQSIPASYPQPAGAGRGYGQQVPVERPGANKGKRREIAGLPVS